MNQAIVFLFYPKLAEEVNTTPRKTDPVDDFRTDFISRFAEVNFHPEPFRPHIRILSFEAAEESEDALEKLGEGKGVALDRHPDDNEDTVMEAMQAICEHLVGRQKERTTIRLDEGADLKVA